MAVSERLHQSRAGIALIRGLAEIALDRPSGGRQVEDSAGVARERELDIAVSSSEHDAMHGADVVEAGSYIAACGQRVEITARPGDVDVPGRRPAVDRGSRALHADIAARRVRVDHSAYIGHHDVAA